MLTLDQLPFQAEGYRDLVCLITNCGKWHCGPAVGSRRRGGGWTLTLRLHCHRLAPQFMRGITQILITMTTEPRPCRGTAKILATATPDGGIANFLLPVTEHLHTSREHLPKARKPASIADTRFEQKREQRQTCCDQCNHLKVGNQAGAFYHRDDMPPAGERKAAWERGDWDASWYCIDCYRRHYKSSYAAVREMLGFTERAEKKARYAKGKA